MTKKFILAIIRGYQKTFSPDHGIRAGYTPYGCKFYPTCSQYTYESIEKYGIIKGILKGSMRILRCNPFSKGGVDQV